MAKRIPKEEWIRRDKEIHGDKDDYSLVINGMTSKNKQKFICLVNKNHGIYEQIFNSRLSINKKCRCPKCGPELIRQQKIKPIEEWIQRDNEINENKDDYSLVIPEISSIEKQKFKCLVNINHGIYEQSFHVRINQKQRCPKCKGSRISKSNTIPIEIWITRDKEIHGDKDDYSLVISGILSKNKQKFICLVDKSHGIYEQSFGCRIDQKQRCPKCSNKLRVENMVGEILKEFFPEHYFEKIRPDWLINPKTGRKLELDYYNKELSLAIEVQGKQHYTTDSYNDTPEKLQEQKYRDGIKTTECPKNGIKLLIIHYNTFKYSHKQLKIYIEKKLIKMGLSIL